MIQSAKTQLHVDAGFVFLQLVSLLNTDFFKILFHFIFYLGIFNFIYLFLI